MEFVLKSKTCPQCQAAVPVFYGYVAWCDKCGWNIDPQESTISKNIFEQLYISIGRKQSQSLLNELIGAESLGPRLTLSKLLAFLFSTAVHGITVAFAVVGILLPLMTWPNVFAIIGGMLCLGIAFMLAPRKSRFPDGVLSKEAFPHLYQLVDSVSQALDASKVKGIKFSEDFNASFQVFGRSRESLITIGLPLWSILDPEEQIALIAHELAHGINGDCVRGRYIGTAIQSLCRWYNLLRPECIYDPRAGIYGILMIPSNLFMLCLSEGVRLAIYILSHLVWRDSQRAEYLADCLAAGVSGVNAFVGLLEKLSFGATFQLALQKAALSNDKVADLFDELRKQIIQVPERERERLRRLGRLEQSRLDATHPPTADRMDLLKARNIPQPVLQIRAINFQQAETELIPLRKMIQERALDAYRASLYL